MWVLTRNGLEHAETKITAGELNEKLREYRKALLKNRESDNQELTALGKQLYADLISPVESRGFLDGTIVSSALFLTRVLTSYHSRLLFHRHRVNT